MSSQTDFSNGIVLAPVSAVPEGEVIQVVAAGRELALYNVDGTFYASDDLCNHGKANLSDGYLDGDVIECPLHGGCFNVRDGAPCGAPVTKPMKVYTVDIHEGNVVLVNPAELQDES